MMGGFNIIINNKEINMKFFYETWTNKFLKNQR
jgi:hypothetical protein